MRDPLDETGDDQVERLRAGDEPAFSALVDELHGPLLRLARTFTRSQALAEDIVQETWIGVIRGIDRFEGRSSLRTWIFGILIRRARTLAARDARRRVGEAAASPPGLEWEPGAGKRGLWSRRPIPWGLDDPASVVEGEEALAIVAAAFENLPESQRQVVQLRDVEGLSATEVCNILGLSETNQRVLLHRGRAAVRNALDRAFREGERLRALGLAIGSAVLGLGGVG